MLAGCGVDGRAARLPHGRAELRPPGPAGPRLSRRAASPSRPTMPRPPTALSQAMAADGPDAWTCCSISTWASIAPASPPGPRPPRSTSRSPACPGLRPGGLHVYDGHNHQEQLRRAPDSRAAHLLEPVLAMRTRLVKQGPARAAPRPRRHADVPGLRQARSARPGIVARHLLPARSRLCRQVRRPGRLHAGRPAADARHQPADRHAADPRPRLQGRRQRSAGGQAAASCSMCRITCPCCRTRSISSSRRPPPTASAPATRSSPCRRTSAPPAPCTSPPTSLRTAGSPDRG